MAMLRLSYQMTIMNCYGPDDISETNNLK